MSVDSVLLLSYSIVSGALESPDLLPSCSIITMPLHITIILIITHLQFQPLNQINKLVQLRGGARGNSESTAVYSRRKIRKVNIF